MKHSRDFILIFLLLATSLFACDSFKGGKSYTISYENSVKAKNTVVDSISLGEDIKLKDSSFKIGPTIKTTISKED